MLCDLFLGGGITLQIQNLLTYKTFLPVPIVRKFFLYFIWHLSLSFSFFYFHSFVLVWLWTTKHTCLLQCKYLSAVWRHFSSLPWSFLFPDKMSVFLDVPHEMCVCVCSVTKALCNPIDCSPPGSSVHRIFQTRILEQVSISYFRGPSLPRDQTGVSCVACLGSQILYHCTTWKAPTLWDRGIILCS